VTVFAFLYLNLIFSQGQDFSKVKIKTIKVSKNIYMLIGAGGNIGVSAGQDGVYIIDDQYAPLNKKIKQAVKKISNKTIRFVINTHWHGDHTGGNELMGKTGSVIIAQENVRKRMSVENFNTVLNRKTPPSPKNALPVITFPQEMGLHLNNELAKIIHFKNAHTDGDSIVYFPQSNVLHTGDIFVNGLFPFVDADAGGSFLGILAAVKEILTLCDDQTKIIPGHGLLGNKKDLQQYFEMLKTVKMRLSALIAKGKSIDQVVALNPLKDLDQKWGQGFMKLEMFTRIVYNSLKLAD